MSHEILGLITLAISLLGTVIVTTWRSSAVTTELRLMIAHLDKRINEQNERQKAVETIPTIQTDIEYLKKNHSMIPKLSGEVEVLKAKADFSKELRAQRASRPDFDT